MTSKQITPPNPFQRVPPSGDREFKHMSMWGPLMQTISALFKKIGSGWSGPLSHLSVTVGLEEWKSLRMREHNSMDNPFL